jgi:hypothetical protein
MSGRKAVISAAIVFALSSATVAHASVMVTSEFVHDLTHPNSSVTIDGAIFATTDTQPTGSGVIHSFVRVSAANQGIVQGYNTDGRPLQFDENNSATFTRHQNLDDMKIVRKDGVDYYQFLLDINQRSSEPLLTLNEVEIWLGDAPGLLGYSPNRSGGGTGFGAHATFVYDIDEINDNAIDLDYNLNSGSGSGDMYAYIPKARFTGPNKFVYLYSKFGIPHENNDGYEEWAALEGPNPIVPEPCSLLSGTLFLGLAASRFPKRKRSA